MSSCLNVSTGLCLIWFSWKHFTDLKLSPASSCPISGTRLINRIIIEPSAAPTPAEGSRLDIIGPSASFFRVDNDWWWWMYGCSPRDSKESEYKERQSLILKVTDLIFPPLVWLRSVCVWTYMQDQTWHFFLPEVDCQSPRISLESKVKTTGS